MDDELNHTLFHTSFVPTVLPHRQLSPPPLFPKHRPNQRPHFPTVRKSHVSWIIKSLESKTATSGSWTFKFKGMRSTRPLLRGAKGYNWYQKFVEKGSDAFKKHVQPTPFDWTSGEIVRPKAFFDIRIEKEDIGRIVFELASDVVPKTVTNFINLCNGTSKFCYKNTKIHDIRKECTVMGGDVEMLNGKGGHSSFGERFFADENFIIPHTSRGLISMATIGVKSNNSQFYISLSPASHLNGRSVVFGRIVEGDDVLKKIQEVFTVRGMSVREIVIHDCGLLKDNSDQNSGEKIAA
eukprot:gene6897-13997_t